jgi:antitoxin CptB
MALTQLENDLSRVRWQCRRGMLELDALLGDFVEGHYLNLTPQQRASFHIILDYPDQMLFDYFFGQSIPIDKDVADVIQWIRQVVTPQT